MDFEVLWLIRICLGRLTVCQKIRSVNKGGPKLWTRKNAKIGRVAKTFASRRSRPRSGWANGTLKLLLAPDCPDRTVSEKLEKILGCSKLALPEATKLVLASKLGQQNLAWSSRAN
jgi:hypothetical protein